MITYKDWCTLLVLVSFCLPEPLWAFSFALNKQSISIGETAILSIHFSETSRDGNPLVLDELLNQHPKLKVLERNMSRDENSLTMTFEITAYQAGDYRVPPIQIKWGSNTYSTEATELKVTTTRGPQDMEIRSDFGTLKTPFPWRKAYFWMIASLGALLGLWIIRWTITRIPWRQLKRLSLSFRWPSFETDRRWLKKEVRRLRQELKVRQADPELVDQIFYTLAVFLQRKTHSPIPALTSTELMKELPNKLSQEKVKAILEEKDQFKYQKPDKTEAPRVAEDLLSQIERQFL